MALCAFSERLFVKVVSTILHELVNLLFKHSLAHEHFILILTKQSLNEPFDFCNRS